MPQTASTTAMMTSMHGASAGSCVDSASRSAMNFSPNSRRVLRPCTSVKTVGTKNSVATVAKISPPMTARPRGAFCSPLSPRPRAMGIMPMIMAVAVMMTGRRRVNPASSAASRALNALVHLLSREADDENAVRGSDPHAHDRAGERGHAHRGMGEEQHPYDARQCGGKRGNDDQGIEQRLEIDDDQHVHQDDGSDQAEQQAMEGLLHGFDLALEVHGRALGQILLGLVETLLNCVATKPKSVPCTLP